MRLALFIPKFTNKLGWDGSVRHYDYMEERLHLLATMMALFPFTPTEELAKEFMVSEQMVKFIGWLYGAKRSRKYRRKVCIENGREQFIKNLWAKKRKDIRNYGRRRENRNKVTTGTDEDT